MGALVYDFGMNNGDDTDYYLAKGHRVVGVEANPALCEACRLRFGAAIGDGHLTILNVALSEADTGTIDFYLHRTNHVLSQVQPPAPDRRAAFEAIRVPQRTASAIVREHGAPHYVKIDLEGIDQIVLADLFAHGIRPDFISAESHTVAVFAALVAAGYRAFNLVDGSSVAQVYGDAEIAGADGPRRHAFPHHSAGPYGEDLRTPWLDADAFFYHLAAERLGWKDIHASRVIEPGPAPRP